MKTALALLVGSVIALAGCAGGGDAAPGAPAEEADIIKASCLKVGNQCIKNGMNVLPKSGSGAFVREKCFHWNRGSKDVSRIDAEDKNAEFDGLFHMISESRDKKQDDLTIMQLRLTLKYMQVEGNVDKMSVDQLFVEADDPIFTHWELKGTPLKFVQVNIALGDNPMDVVFKEGTLDPIVAAEDDSVSFCAAELKGK